MTIREVANLLGLKVLSGSGNLDRTVDSVYCSDMLSRVMGGGSKDCIWITVQTHMNVIAVATLLEMACVIFPEDIEAEKAVYDTSEKEGIPLLSTNLSAYELCGKMYELRLGRHEGGC